MPHRCEQETSRNCHAFNWIMGQILSQHNYSNDAPTRQTHSGLGSEPAWPATNCNRISQGAQQLFPTHTERVKERKREREGEWKMESSPRQPQDIARPSLAFAFAFVSVFFTISGWRQGGACARHLKVGVPDDLKGF